jgi:hypothetical protein
MTLAEILHGALPAPSGELADQVRALRDEADATCNRLTDEYQRMSREVKDGAFGQRNQVDYWKAAGRYLALRDVLDLIRAGAK